MTLSYFQAVTVERAWQKSVITGLEPEEPEDLLLQQYWTKS